MDGFVDRIRRQKKENYRIYQETVGRIYGTVDVSCNQGEFESGGKRAGELEKRLLEYFKLPPSAHLVKRRIKLEQNWWKQDAFPLIGVCRETGEPELLLPGKWGGYVRLEQGKEQRINAKTASGFEDMADCVYPPFGTGGFSVKTFILALLKAYRPSDWMMLALMSIAVVVMGMAAPLVNQYIFHTVLPSGTLPDLIPVMAVLLGVTASVGLFRILRSIWILRIGDKGRLWAEAGIWNKAFRMPAAFYKKFEAGDFTERIFMLTAACEAILEGLFPAVFSLVFSLLYLLQISMMAEPLAGPSAGILLLVILTLVSSALFCTRMNQALQKVETQMRGFLYQVYSGIRKIKLCGAEIRAFAEWGRMYEKKAKLQFRPPFFVKYVKALLSTTALGGTLLVYHSAFRGGVSVSAYLSYQAAFASLMASAYCLGEVGEQLAFIRPALRLAKPILEEEEEDSGDKKTVKHLSGEVELSNLWFRYKPDQEDVLKGVSVKISPGEYVAVTGPSGSGKSTLFRLLLNFEQPRRGMIAYDGNDLSLLDSQSVRRHIGTVLQDGRLLEGDIYSNIALCAPGLTRQQAWEAAEQAGIAEDIKAMPMGMFTMVSNNGGGISGGQKQRILIARTLAMKPDILLFDEATSALDNLSQAQVVKSLEALSCTRIVIAHRLSTIRACDRILYLEDGVIKEQGTYQELAAAGGGFAALAKRQLITPACSPE